MSSAVVARSSAPWIALSSAVGVGVLIGLIGTMSSHHPVMWLGLGIGLAIISGVSASCTT
jgi:hypothetical protein